MRKYIVLSDVGLQDVNPVEYGDEQCTPDKEHTRSVREYYLLHYVYSGTGTYQVNDEVHTIGPGQLFIAHPYEPIHYEPNPADPWHYGWVGFFTTLDIPRLKNKHILDARHAEHIFRAISATDETMFGREYYIAGKIMELLSTMVRPETNASQKNFVDLAAEYIQRNYTRPITMDSLAEQFHVTHSYFSTAFRQQMGISPYQYLMDLRLARAAELMAEHNYNVSEAAISVGYNSIYNFSKMFKKKFGVSPSHYAAEQRK